MKIKQKASLAALIAWLAFFSIQSQSTQAALPVAAASSAIITDISSQVDASGMDTIEAGAYWINTYADYLASAGKTIGPDVLDPSKFDNLIADVAAKFGPQAGNAIAKADWVLPRMFAVIALLRIAHAGYVTKKQGYGFADGALDDMIYQSGYGVSPEYIATNKTMLTALDKLAHDPSLDGSYLSNMANMANTANQANTDKANDPVAQRRRQMAEGEGKELYGPNYKLPADYDPN